MNENKITPVVIYYQITKSIPDIKKITFGITIILDNMIKFEIKLKY